MKKLFTLTALALLISVGASAADKLRKTWDFRNGFSSITVANLKADMEENGATEHWRNYETNASQAGDKAYWCGNSINLDEDGNLCTTVGGSQSVISETKGLNFPAGKFTQKKLVICYNNTQTEDESAPNGMYTQGKSFLWFNGKGLTFTFQAQKGQTLKMGIESHSKTANRGITVTTSDGAPTCVEGNATPTYYNDVTWKLPEGDGTTTVTVTTTNGCHIYYIIVGEGDSEDDLKDKVAYLYNGETDGMYDAIASLSGYKVTPIDLSTTSISRESLASYDVTAISGNIPADNANVATLKEILPYQPVLNFNAGLYKAWGYGEAVTTDNGFVVTNKSKDPVFSGATLVPGSEIDMTDEYYGIPLVDDDSNYSALKLGSYFADDDVLANVYQDETGLVAMHKHNINHNGYIYMPGVAVPSSQYYVPVINNALAVLVASKADVTATAAPAISVDYAHQSAKVSINSPEPYSQIYYTTDGTEPAIGTGTLYTEPFTLTAVTTVKAIAQGQGYDPSEISEAEVKMYDQVATPTISVSQADDAATISLACATENATIWYNFGAARDTTVSTKYTEPFVINDVATISFFATAADHVTSELASEKVYIQNDKVYIDAVSHFDANKNSYGPTNNTYIFSWGKNGSDQYDTTKDPVDFEVGEDGTTTPVYPLRDPETYPSEETITANNLEWVCKSYGQSMVWQSLSTGKDVGDAGGYNPATSADLDTLTTANCIQFYNVSSNQLNASILSLKKFQAPFDIVSFLGTSTGSQQKGVFQVSADGENWTTVDTISFKVSKRLFKKFTVPYRGTDEVYVRLTSANTGLQAYDIYIMNEGEKSKALEEQLAEEGKDYLTGIEDVNVANGDAKVAAVYSINGTKLGALKSGINIVKYSNGAVKKVIVK